MDETISPCTGPGVHDAVFRLIRKGESGRALDFGAGHGALSKKLSENGFRVTAADADPSGFKYGKISCVKADASQAWPFKNAEFEFVFLIEVIEHLENQWNAFREAARVLGRGGTLLVSTPNIMSISSRIHFLAFADHAHFEENRMYSEERHISPVSVKQLKCMAASAGFELVATTSNEKVYPPGLWSYLTLRGKTVEWLASRYSRNKNYLSADLLYGDILVTRWKKLG